MQEPQVDLTLRLQSSAAQQSKPVSPSHRVLQTELTAAHQREQQLRERLSTIDEALAHKEQLTRDTSPDELGAGDEERRDGRSCDESQAARRDLFEQALHGLQSELDNVTPMAAGPNFA